MLSPDELKEISTKSQTSEKNVAREYAQHVFLSFLYQDPGSDKVFFKGGTALRILFQSPRFSEDLDFSANISLYKTKELIERTAIKTRQEIASLKLEESKPTTGGYFGILAGSVGSSTVEVQIQVSLRQKAEKGELMVIAPPTVPAYNVLSLQEKSLISEKLEALLSRAKPRDFYDLYFILRKPLGDRRQIASKKAAVLKKLKSITSKSLYQELREFLPKSHWTIIQHLPEQLEKELGRL
ncbi:MAG: nucleotidyl transferase AbiEii/AbiGii toxin family protein [Elusimicrobia bacterium]|nr:nucleotidyl transferase AbiEii/AbiGii toxin family protein [Elusimicrobiota bacterium]